MKVPLSPDAKAQVLEELRAVLESTAFSGSRRGQQFLQFVVENSLAGHSDLLKERSIGVELFGRSPSYDTGDDSVVRVTAGDVRQRLQRYLDSLIAHRGVEIHLPSGSYTPEYVFSSKDGPLAGFGRRRRWARLAGTVLLGCLLLAGLGYVSYRLFHRSPLARFWAPFEDSASPVLICISNQPAYYFPHPTERLGPGRKPGSAVPVDEIFPVSVANPTDAAVAVQLASILGKMGQPTRMRSSDATSFDDLRNSPAILIGAFGNQWTMQMTGQLRFAYGRIVGREWFIREQAAPFRHWELPDELPGPSKRPNERDFALVSRIFDRASGQPFVAIGGIGGNGTQAAAECVVSAECLAAVVRNLSPGWERRNLQFVITTKIVSGSPGAPEVVASDCW